MRVLIRRVREMGGQRRIRGMSVGRWGGRGECRFISGDGVVLGE